MNPTEHPFEPNEQETALLELAQRVAEHSPDRSRKVGVVLMDKDYKIITAGCNTLPLNIPHEDQYLTRPAKYDWTEHAERNAIYEAAREGHATKGCTIILPWFPCVECARAIVQAGVSRIVASYPDVDDPTWGAGFKIGLALFEKAGVQFDILQNIEAPQAIAEGVSAHNTDHRDRPSITQMVQEWNDALPAPKLAPRSSRPGR
jgi:dCMP deaminase